MGYSWDIHMYRVCVGYVSGMYRERVGAYGQREGAKKQVKNGANHGRARMGTETRDMIPPTATV